MVVGDIGEYLLPPGQPGCSGGVLDELQQLDRQPIVDEQVGAGRRIDEPGRLDGVAADHRAATRVVEAVADARLDRRVLDLSSGGDFQLLRPEVEAAVAVVKQRVGEVRQASGSVVQSLAPE